jgi:hypothetical protein
MDIVHMRGEVYKHGFEIWKFGGGENNGERR